MDKKEQLFNEEHCDLFFFHDSSLECEKLDANIWLPGSVQLLSVGEGKSLLVMQSIGMVLLCVCVCMCCFIVLPFTQHTDLSKCQSNVISACRQTGFIYLNVCRSVCLCVYTHVCKCTWCVVAGRVKNNHDLFSGESVPVVVPSRLLLWNNLHWACAEHRLVWLLRPHGRLKLLIVAHALCIEHRITEREVARDDGFLDRIVTDLVEHEVTFRHKISLKHLPELRLSNSHSTFYVCVFLQLLYRL